MPTGITVTAVFNGKRHNRPGERILVVPFNHDAPLLRTRLGHDLAGPALRHSETPLHVVTAAPASFGA